jgi:hypothetical protein
MRIVFALLILFSAVSLACAPAPPPVDKQKLADEV